MFHFRISFLSWKENTSFVDEEDEGEAAMWILKAKCIKRKEKQTAEKVKIELLLLENERKDEKNRY